METESVMTSKSDEIKMKTIGVTDASRIQFSNPNSLQADIAETNVFCSESLGDEHPSSTTISRGQDKSKDANETKGKSGARAKRGSIQKTLTVMFFVLILANTISYIPPLVFLILTYSIEDFNFIKLSKTEALVWIYVPRLVFLNHVVNPFI
jgi:hypothetical protein